MCSVLLWGLFLAHVSLSVCRDTISDSAKQLIRRMLCVNVAKRITLRQIEECDWLTKKKGAKKEKSRASGGAGSRVGKRRKAH